MTQVQNKNFSTEEYSFLLDTHQIIKDFMRAGFTEEQAEVVVNQQKKIIENNLANKQDILKLDKKLTKEIKEVEAKLTKEIEEVKKEIKEVEGKLTKEIVEVKRDIKELKKETIQIRIDFKKDMEILQKKIIFRLGSLIVISFGILATLIKFF